jgi:hypothetical protein
MYVCPEYFHICGMWRSLFFSVATVFAIMGRLFMHKQHKIPCSLHAKKKSSTFFHERAFIKVKTITHYFF